MPSVGINYPPQVVFFWGGALVLPPEIACPPELWLKSITDAVRVNLHPKFL